MTHALPVATARCRRSSTITAVLALLAALSISTSLANGAAPRWRVTASIATADQVVVVSGKLASRHSRARSSWRAVLQQRVSTRGHSVWRDRARGRVRPRGVTGTFRLRWLAPPAPAPLVLRVRVLSGSRVVGRSVATTLERSARPSSPASTASVGATSVQTAGTIGENPSPGPGSIVRISEGAHHVCTVRSGGSVSCWGGNEGGQLGNGTFGYSLSPQTVGEVSTATAVSAGLAHTCAVRAGGSIECWGDGANGQLGTGASPGDGPDGRSSYTPAAVAGITDAIAVAAGSAHTCSVLTTGIVKCWGRGDSGQLGDGRLASSDLPVTVQGITDAVAVIAGSRHSCALLRTGIVECWGEAGFGVLGTGSYTADSSTPVPVTGIVDAIELSGNYLHVCALLSSGSIACWGNNTYGELGDGTTATTPTAVAVSAITNATAISAAGVTTCALTSTGSIACWGRGDEGQLGNGTQGFFEMSTSPVGVTAITNATAISIGGGHVCALLATATVECWGLNDRGQFGNDTMISSSIPTPAGEPSSG